MPQVKYDFEVKLRLSCFHACFIADAEAYRNARFQPGEGPIFLDRLRCVGSEASLLNCSRGSPLGLTTGCGHNDDAGVKCGKYWLVHI